MCGTSAPERRAAAPRGQPLPPISSYLFARHHHICTHVHSDDIHISDLKRPANPPRLSFPSHTRVLLYLELPGYRAGFPSPPPPPGRTPSPWLICKFGDVDRDNSRYSKNRSSLVSRVGGHTRDLYDRSN